MSHYPLHPNRRVIWRGPRAPIPTPRLGRSVALDAPPNVFVLLADATCNEATRSVFNALLDRRSEIPAMRFYAASNSQEVADYVVAYDEPCSVNPVVITGTNERKSFRPYAHSALSHECFKRRGLENSTDWMIEVSSNAPDKCIKQCVHCLMLWFGKGNFPDLISGRTGGLIAVPWGTLPAGDKLILE